MIKFPNFFFIYFKHIIEYVIEAIERKYKFLSGKIEFMMIQGLIQVQKNTIIILKNESVCNTN